MMKGAHPTARVLGLTLLTLMVIGYLSHGCAEPVGCLGGDDGVCVPPSPCHLLFFQCEDPALELRIVGGVQDRPLGLDALAARGDVLLANDRIIAVIDGAGSPHYLAPGGGTLLDLVARDTQRGLAGDELNQMMQSVGILPYDAVHYSRLELLDESPRLVAVIARGRLDGRPDVEVVTRYEVRPCEPGLRVRTELHHGGRDEQAFMLSDVFWWGDREVTPFVPLKGQGFVHPELDLLELDDAIFDVPFVAAPGHAPGASAYGVTRCDAPTAEAFQSTTVSALGTPRTIVVPGDGIAYERFIAVAHGPGAGGAINVCREVRDKIFGESSVWVRGSVRTPSGVPVGGDERLVSLLIYEPAAGDDPDSAEGRTPQAQVVPAADGTFAIRLPPLRAYRVQASVHGHPLPSSSAFVIATADRTIDDVVVPPTGIVGVEIADEAGNPVIADVILTPAAPTTRSDVAGSIHGAFDVSHCAPYLGPPHGSSPACNRVLVSPSGSTSFAAPAGTFYLYASRGPFATLARQLIEVRDGERVDVSLVVRLLPELIPDGVLSADFHVHAGASFDSSLPEIDRALSFVSSGVDVIAATDHDVVTHYTRAIAELGIADRVTVMPGVETTGQILFHEPPGSEIPQVIGHFNFWPLRVDESLPRNGAPFDEVVEPGALFDRIEPLYDGDGVTQLNHPFADSTFGRDEGFLTAIGYDPRVTVPAVAIDSPAGQLRRISAGGTQNIDYDVQEVMNGASTRGFLNYRAGWHSFLTQGILKGGTANSDSHTLAVEALGYPRTLVFGGHTLAAFDRERFNADVRNGRMVGTNGPILLTCVDGDDGTCHEPSLQSFRPAPGAELHIEVRAAPWIPVEEIRVIVNGKSVRSITSGLAEPADPFGSDTLVRYQGTIVLDELLVEAEGDAWMVIEAGLPLWLAADLEDDDGLVDTTDNNGDGVVDGADEKGSYKEPPTPEEDDARYHLHTVAPGTYPTSFTNPLLIDHSGDGWNAPGLP